MTKVSYNLWFFVTFIFFFLSFMDICFGLFFLILLSIFIVLLHSLSTVFACVSSSYPCCFAIPRSLHMHFTFFMVSSQTQLSYLEDHPSHATSLIHLPSGALLLPFSSLTQQQFYWNPNLSGSSFFLLVVFFLPIGLPVKISEHLLIIRIKLIHQRYNIRAKLQYNNQAQSIMEQLNLIGTSNCWEGFTTMYSRFAARQLLSIVMDDEAIVACVFEFLRLEDLAVFSVSSREINSKIRNSPVLQNKILKLRISRLRRPMKTGISCVDQLSIMGDIHESEHFEGGQADALGLAVMFGEKKLIFRKVPPILSPLQAIKKKQSSKMKVNSKRTQKNAEKLMATTKMLTFSQLNKPRDDLKTVQQLQKDARLQKIIKAEVPQTKTYLLEYDEDSSKYIYEIEHKYALKQPDSSYYVRRETLWERLKSNFTERR